jgi:hypothetical protein
MIPWFAFVVRADTTSTEGYVVLAIGTSGRPAPPSTVLQETEYSQTELFFVLFLLAGGAAAHSGFILVRYRSRPFGLIGICTSTAGTYRTILSETTRYSQCRSQMIHSRLLDCS